MLVGIEIVRLTPLALVVGARRSHGRPVCDVAIYSVGLLNDHLDLFVKVIFGNGAKPPTAHIILSESQSGGASVDQIHIQGIDWLPIALPRVERAVAELHGGIRGVITAIVPLTGAVISYHRFVTTVPRL